MWNAPQIIIETVKQAEDGDGLIVRLYEHERTQKVFDLHAGFPLAEACRCNLLEENEERLDVTKGRATAAGTAVSDHDAALEAGD